MTEIERVRYDLGGVISDLKDEVARLEREADWLSVNGPDCPCTIGANTFCIRHCPIYKERRDNYKFCSHKELREAAKRAVEDD